MLQSADGYLNKNKWVLRDLLNEPTDWLCIIAGGNWFQSLGANREKARSPIALWVLGILRVGCEEDRVL